MNCPMILAIAMVIGHTGAIHANQDHRVAFVTSVTGTGNLSTWPDAGNEAGLAAGDAICRARAAAAGLSNAENFIAWLSDSDNDAYCRIHGLSGRREDNCGQAVLPEAAGPWVRTDGFPFSGDISALTSPGPVVFTPLRLDEFGEPVSVATIFTGTFQAGVGILEGVSTLNCGNWTVDANDGETRPHEGSATDTGRRWTSVSNPPSCHLNRTLACLELGPGPDLPDFRQPGRAVFLSSVSGPGDMSAWPQAQAGTVGIAAADSVCRNLAEAAELDEPQSFKAWLSDAETNAIDRFENDGRWVRIDGVPVASSKSDLTDGELFTAIMVNEKGEYQNGFAAPSVWSGASASGQTEDDHCNSWTDGSDAASGKYGLSYTTTERWTQFFLAPSCEDNRRLFCLSDAVDPMIFSDRFQP